MHAQLIDNLSAVRERIAAAALRSGRSAAEVTLVGVTKYVGIDLARALAEAGCTDLGESRPQELWDKAAALTNRPVRWHMIGHLQRNKVARTLATGALIHSVDSLRVAETIDTEAAKLGCRARVLLEVNISGDEAKHGFAPSELPQHVPRFASFEHVQVLGLMAMSGLNSGPDETSREFTALRTLRDQLRSDSPSSLPWDELSMGMSDDYEIAIAAGATLVRVGSALFAGLNDGPDNGAV